MKQLYDTKTVHPLPGTAVRNDIFLMKILLIGDSITEGTDGYSFVRLLQADYPNDEFVNLGLGGDTLLGISQRLLAELANISTYDAIVFAAGHNDLLIPHMQQGTSQTFQYIARTLIQRGSIPTPDGADFACILQATIDELQAIYRGPVIITTLSCLGERLDNKLNQQRQQLNAAIRQVADANGLCLADVGAVFDAQLQGKKTAVTVLGNPYAMITLDKLLSRTRAGVTRLSRYRHTHLTIDGVHLNYEGALIYKDTIQACLPKT